jgi:hypothetical protein
MLLDVDYSTLPLISMCLIDGRVCKNGQRPSGYSMPLIPSHVAFMSLSHFSDKDALASCLVLEWLASIVLFPSLCRFNEPRTERNSLPQGPGGTNLVSFSNIPQVLVKLNRQSKTFVLQNVTGLPYLAHTSITTGVNAYFPNS